MNANPEAPRLLTRTVELVCGKHTGRPMLLGAIGSDPFGVWGTATPGFHVEPERLQGRTSWQLLPRHDARPCELITSGAAWKVQCKCGEAVMLTVGSAQRILDNRAELITATRQWFTLPDTADTFGIHPTHDEFAALQVVRAYLERARV